MVIAQWPPPRAQAPRVSLLVNRGEAGLSYVMPDLIGLDASDASAVLRNNGFRVAVVSEQPYPGVPRGTVIRQQPSAGFRIALGESISLEVSR
jgi:beta-lactam-binding protein with PASTA domain